MNRGLAAAMESASSCYGSVTTCDRRDVLQIFLLNLGVYRVCTHASYKFAISCWHYVGSRHHLKMCFDYREFLSSGLWRFAQLWKSRVSLPFSGWHASHSDRSSRKSTLRANLACGNVTSLAVAWYFAMHLGPAKKFSYSLLFRQSC